MSIYRNTLVSTPLMSVIMEYNEIIIIAGQSSTIVFEDEDDSDDEE